MGTATNETLVTFLRSPDAGPLQLKGIRETADSVYLGAVGLSLKEPLFHSILGFNFSGRLSPDAAFRVEAVTGPDSELTALVAVFRQFESSRFQDFPEDIVMGWVPTSAADALATWMSRMTAQLTHLLAVRAQKSLA